MIEQERIERIKADVDLKALAQSKGIRLKKNGKGYFGLCPFHQDKNPSLSITPSKNQWHCFGCGKGGDVIRFVELYDQVDFKEAVKRLDTSLLTAKTAIKRKTDQKSDLTPAHTKLFNRVIEFYHTAFAEDLRAKEYLNKRGITDNSIFKDYKTGFANGTLLKILPEDKKIIKQLKEIGILNTRGKELFYNCVTFPVFDLKGNPVGMYGRRIDNKGSHHLYLPGDRKAVFNWQAAKAHKDIILTESILDSLTLINAGIKNTIPCYGINGLTDDHLDLFKQYQTQHILICFDADKPGIKAAKVIQHTLETSNLKADIVTLPENQDINDFFLLTASPEESFMDLLNQTDSDAVKNKKAPMVLKTEYGFAMTIDDRQYEIRGINRQNSKLKATVKGIINNNMHVDTVDFYSARSRNFLIKGLCSLFNKEESLINKDVTALLQQAERYKTKDPDKEPEQAMTDKDKAEALKFLQNPDMFTQILKDYETLGYTGEEMNKLLCYIAAISRKMENPLSVMIQSRSAAGKSYLQDTVLSLVPNEDCVKYTRLTDQALFYTGSKSLYYNGVGPN